MDELLRRHNQVMGEGAPLFFETPLELLSGEGVWLDAADGIRYLDLYNNVPCVGHSNPRVAAALTKQATTLNVHSRYLHRNVIEYVERLVGLHHDGIESAILACSGTEATELGIRLARRATGKHGIICTDTTYHGNSTVVGQLRRLPRSTELDGVRSISYPQMYRPIEDGLDESELKARYIAQLRDTIEMMQENGGFAGLMLCSILANEGLPTVPEGWYAEAVDVVHEAGGLMIADEVQSGFGRSGRMWGYEVNNFIPDIVCMGKPMGNGLPVSGVAASHEMISDFRKSNFYFNTYASSPMQAAAGMAVLDELADRDLVASAAALGANVMDALRTLQPHHPAVGDVRGVGLFIGIEWVDPETNAPDTAGATVMQEALKARGMLVGRAGEKFNVLKVRPPLVFEQQHADLFLSAFADATEATKPAGA